VRLCELLEIDPARLAELAAGAAGRYTRIRLPRPGRAPRAIDAPDSELKAVQRGILGEVLARLRPSRWAHGFVRGRSIVTAAEPHAGKELVATFDIRDFFPSVREEAVGAIGRELGLSPEDLPLLVKLTALRGSLPQGAPTSPCLANLAFRACDARLGGLAASLGLAYTRYADDLIFSGGPAARRLSGSVGRVLEEGGFRLAAEKTRIMPRSRRQEVCGLVVNDGVRLPRRHRRALRAMVHDLAARGAQAAARGRGSGFPSWLAGHLAHLAAVQPEVADRLLAEIQDLPETGA
jgi:hypothetical protein